MAKQKRSGQNWWPMYGVALMMMGLLILAHRLAPSPGWRIFLEVGAVIVSYGLMAWWLETHPNILLDRPAAEADSPAVVSPQVEVPAGMSSRVRVHFHVGSDPALIYHLPEPSTSPLHSNGHHLAKPTSALPEQKRQPNNSQSIKMVEKNHCLGV